MVGDVENSHSSFIDIPDRNRDKYTIPSCVNEYISWITDMTQGMGAF